MSLWSGWVWSGKSNGVLRCAAWQNAALRFQIFENWRQSRFSISSPCAGKRREGKERMGGNPAQSKVKVIVRVRPLLENEPNTPCACAVDSKHVRLLIPGRTQSYSFKYASFQLCTSITPNKYTTQHLHNPIT